MSIPQLNKIYLGDCLKVLKTFDNDSFDDAFTSPPYNRKVGDKYKYYRDNVSDYYKLLCDVTSELLRVTKHNVIINIQSMVDNKRDVALWYSHFADYIKGRVIWCKTNPQPGNNERNGLRSVTNAFEDFYVFGKDNTDFVANQRVANYLLTPINSKHFEGHGAVMKEEVADFFIENFTTRGGAVIDPFFGCGTTGVACVHFKRSYVGIELVEKYKTMAENRIYNETSKQSLFSDSIYENIDNYTQESFNFE